MNVIVAKDYTEQSRLAADIVEKIVREDPCCCLGLATGSSPVGMYQELARRCREEGLDFSQVHSVNLDEYILRHTARKYGECIAFSSMRSRSMKFAYTASTSRSNSTARPTGLKSPPPDFSMQMSPCLSFNAPSFPAE